MPRTVVKGKRRKPEASIGKPIYAPRKRITLLTKSDDIEDLGRTYAEHVTSAPVAALRAILAAERGKSGYGDDIDVPTLLATLHEQGEAANTGNLSQAEAMLMNQATALQTLFARLVAWGMGWDELEPFEAYMRMALRAQSQCRATLETLAAIKNPPMLFAKQANVTTGPQQINNGMAAPSRPRENEITPNKLSGIGNELLPDTRASQAESRIDTPVGTVDKIDRTEVGGG